MLAQCLRALSAQTAPSVRFEVLVVDNGSTDQTLEMVKAHMTRFHSLRYLFLAEQNTSLARNLGAQEASGEWLAFTDSDCLPPPNWLKHAERIILQRKNLRIFGGPVLDHARAGTRLPVGFVPAGWDQSYGRKERTLADGEYLTECNLIIHRKTFQKSGGFRADLGPGNKRFGFHEGTELQARIRRAHGKEGVALYSPTIPMKHVVRSGRMKSWSRFWRTFLSGYDYARAFPQTPKKLPENFIRILVRGACFLGLSPFHSQAAHRSLFRLGETMGESFGHTPWFSNHIEQSPSSLPGPVLVQKRRREKTKT